MKLTFPIGIEIETGGYSNPSVRNAMLGDKWSEGTDVSSGLEFRSTKLTESEQIFDVERICGILKSTDCHIHRRCGLHVHVGFSHITDLSAKYRLFRFMSAYESTLLDLHSPWSERAKYCMALPESFWSDMSSGKGFKPWEAENAGRYWWFNGAAMMKHGTCEFRLMNGTLDHNLIIGWVSTLQCIFEAAVKQDVKLDWKAAGRSKNTLIHDCLAIRNQEFGQQAIRYLTLN